MLRRLYKVLKASGVRRALSRVPGVDAFIERFVEPRLKDARIEERIAELRQVLHLGPKEEPVVAAGPVEPVAPPPAVVTVPESVEVVAEPELAQVSPPAPEAEKPPEAPVAPEARESQPVPSKKPAPKTRKPKDPLTQLLGALEVHPKRAGLLRAGSGKDQLLRSLIPLYLAQSLPVEVTSGTTSRFWAKQGVKYAAPNVAKALREHPGYSRRTSTGPRITPSGVKYVEAALERAAAA